MTTTTPGTGRRAVPSTTARTLRLLRAVLATGCVVTGALSLLVFTASQRTVDRAVRHSALAVMQVDLVYEALVDADMTAVTEIESRVAQVGGTAGRYGNDIAAVHRGLELVAQYNVAGDEGSRRLGLVGGLVVSYTAQMQQAYADLQRGDQDLSLAYLRYASYLLHEPNAGILDNLNVLRKLEQEALDRQSSSVWVAGATSLLWLVPTLGLLALLVGTQVFIHRRFRRRLSVWLLLAAGALVVMMTVTAWQSLVSGGRFAAAIDGSFAYVTSQSQTRAAATDDKGRSVLSALIGKECAELCAGDIKDSNFQPRPVLEPKSAVSGKVIDQIRKRDCFEQEGTGLTCFEQDADAADTPFTVPALLIAAMAGAAAMLVAFGLRRRINEYRFGRRP